VLTQLIVDVLVSMHFISNSEDSLLLPHLLVKAPHFNLLTQDHLNQVHPRAQLELRVKLQLVHPVQCQEQHSILLLFSLLDHTEASL